MEELPPVLGKWIDPVAPGPVDGAKTIGSDVGTGNVAPSRT